MNGDSEADKNFYELDWFEQYAFSFYNAILQLCGNDINPTNDVLIITGILLLIIGALMNANIFGTMASIFQSSLILESLSFRG